MSTVSPYLDGRTLFVAEELLAGLELLAAGSRAVSIRRLREVAEEVFSRQDAGGEGLSHYFLERGPEGPLLSRVTVPRGDGTG